MYLALKLYNKAVTNRYTLYSNHTNHYTYNENISTIYQKVILIFQLSKSFKITGRKTLNNSCYE